MTATWKSTRRTFLGAMLSVPALGWAIENASPALMLANTYRDDFDASLLEFWVSEKFDGVRAYWDGSQLLTRAGHPILAPRWFTEGLPAQSLDGELWGGRKTFERTSGVVRSNAPDDEDWRTLTYMAFDLPETSLTFDERLSHLNEIVARANLSWLVAVSQTRVRDAAELRSRLRDVEALGGEGLMFHRGASRYSSGRSDDLLKLKSFDDAEAKVIGYVPGQGKYVGMVGALLVEREDGVQFKIGSGLTDRERLAPPPIGSWVSYAYNGTTNGGRPRFARYLRVRSD